jgi:butyrate kinase
MQSSTLPASHACVLVINPGSTSTKLAVFNRKGLIEETTSVHDPDALKMLQGINGQLDMRYSGLMKWVEQFSSLHWVAVVGRGGPLGSLEGGTYRINQEMLDDLASGRFAEHASNLGAIMADRFAKARDLPAFVVDPVTVDNFTPVARISGEPKIERKSRSHALNIKAVAREVADDLGISLDQTRFVVAHLGGGISVCALDKGRIIDVNDALLGMGPFSPERAGALPIGPLVEMAFSGEYTRESLLRKLSRESGMLGYLGTNNMREVEERTGRGDEKALLIFSAMVYQIAKEIGAMSVVLHGELDGIIITGGMAHSDMLFDNLYSQVSFLGKVIRRPGELEMAALARGTFRVLDGEENAKDYQSPPK